MEGWRISGSVCVSVCAIRTVHEEVHFYGMFPLRKGGLVRLYAPHHCYLRIVQDHVRGLDVSEYLESL